MDKIKFIVIALVIILVVVFGKSLFTGIFISPASGYAPSCDVSLWNHVWNSSRLEVVDPCMTVTGTVLSSFQTNDGDQHIQLLPDKQYLKLLNAKNVELQFGALVLEPICTHDPSITNNSTLLDAGIGLADGDIVEESIDACKGFVSRVYIPKVGEYVRVTGSYVLDTGHGWMEIHPVTKISVIG